MSELAWHVISTLGLDMDTTVGSLSLSKESQVNKALSSVKFTDMPSQFYFGAQFMGMVT